MRLIDIRGAPNLSQIDWWSFENLDPSEMPELLARTDQYIRYGLDYPGRLSTRTYRKIDGTVGSVALDPSGKSNMLLETVFNIDDDSLNLAGLNDQAHGVSILYGTSGVGKTVRILKMLSRRFGFFLSVGVTEQYYLPSPSADMNLFIAKLKKRCIDPNQQVANTEFVYRYVACLIASRLHVLLKMLDLNPDLLPSQFLMAQLYPREMFTVDIFEEVTEIFRRFELSRVRQSIQEMLKKLKGSIKSSLLFCVDEAQILCNVLPGYFYSRSHPNESRTLMSPFSAAVAQENLALVLSGTSLSMDAAHKEEASSFHGHSRIFVNSISDEGNIGELLMRYVGVEDRQVMSLYRGRFRSIAILLQEWFSLAETVDRDLNAEDFTAAVTKTSNLILGIFNDLYNRVIGRLQNERLQHFRQQLHSAVEAFAYTGQAAVIQHAGTVSNPNPVAETLFELGFGLLKRDDDTDNLAILLAEPFIAKFAFKYRILEYPSLVTWNDSIQTFHSTLPKEIV